MQLAWGNKTKTQSVARVIRLLGCAALCACFLSTAQAKKDKVDWSNAPAKGSPGWVAPPDPNAQPNPDTSIPQFAPPQVADDYDPRKDPKHPLKNPNEDPGEKWEGAHGKGLNNTFVGKGKGDWDWGEQYYDGVFYPEIKVHNGCDTPQPVTFFVEDLPWLTMPPTMVVPPGDTVVKGTVKLPPEPPPPLLTGAPGESWGHVPIPDFFVPAGQFPPPTIHQPNFAEITGTVIAWHPWSAVNDCNAARDTYTVSGHIHFRPPSPKPDGGPEKIFEADACEVFWKIGEPPPQLDGKDCTERFRELAAKFLDVNLQHYILNSPNDWLWLPQGAQIQTMSMGELLVMKARADATMGHAPQGAASTAPTTVGKATTRELIEQNSLGDQKPDMSNPSIIKKSPDSSSMDSPAAASSSAPIIKRVP